MRSVYAYYFPEVRRLISKLTQNYPHKVFLKSIKPGLDNFHFKVIDKYLEHYREYFPKLKDFGFRYFTNGSSEGIFHLLTYIKVHDNDSPIYVFEGEYEGYKEYAKSLKLEVLEVNPEKTDFEKLEKGFWFISNPSARNGNIIPIRDIEKIAKAGHKIILDLTYVGLTKKFVFDVNHENIFAVVTSLSKPFGLFYYRIGFVFCKEEIETLKANIWFKNIFSLLIAGKIFSKFKPDSFFKKYKKTQKKVLEKIEKDTKISIQASDVVILGFLTKKDAENLSQKQKESIERYKRGDFYRFCLTPYFLETEKKKSKHSVS